MNLLADENIPAASIELLRAAGHDVLAAAGSALGAEDSRLLALASRQKRVLLTFDNDFGRLVFSRRESVPAGVVLLRLTPQSASEVGEIFLDIIIRELPLVGYFSVLDRERMRQRPIS